MSRRSLGALFGAYTRNLMKTCMFCGATEAKITKEHVWSAWISEALKPTMEGDTFTTFRYKDGKEVEHQWEAGEINLQVKDLCRPCNNDWLGRDFEGPIIKPLLVDVIAHAVPARWSAEEQAHIAAWCYKMALVLEFASGKRVWFADDERHEFRRTRAAHPFVSIRVAKHDFSNEGIFKASHSYSAVHTLTAQRDLQQFEVKLTTISAGYFAFQVVGVRSLATGQLVDIRELGPIAFSPQAAASLFQIWPTFWRGVPWPPLQSLNHKDLIDLSEMWAKAYEQLEDPPLPGSPNSDE
jgi:hypothetical protein